jgi:hypothetical protein
MQQIPSFMSVVSEAFNFGTFEMKLVSQPILITPHWVVTCYNITKSLHVVNKVIANW